MEVKNIYLSDFKSPKNSLFTGRPQGEDARQKLKLESIEKKYDKIIFVIPKGTTSFNPSFFLGLLYDSIKSFGIDKYRQKYIFEMEEENEDIIKVLKDNITDGERNAINVIEDNSGLSQFL